MSVLAIELHSCDCERTFSLVRPSIKTTQTIPKWRKYIIYWFKYQTIGLKIDCFNSMNYNLFMDRKKLIKKIEEAVSELTDFKVEVQVDFNSDLKKGDYSTNVAMRLSKELGNPLVSAQKISEKLNLDSEISKAFEKIEVAKPGFINFFLSKDYLIDSLEEYLKESNPGEFVDEKIFEFGDPNPFKEPHIGHLRMFIVGESLCRLMEQNGSKIHRANYQGDVGMHVAKAIWGMIDLNWHEYINKPLEGRAKLLGKAYALGAQKFESDERAKDEIVEINKKVYQRDKDVLEIWEKGRAWSLEYFEKLYKALGVAYEKYYFESQTASKGLEIVKNNTPKVFVEDSGAYIFKGEDEGLHTRVFINSEGNPTYEAKDLALAIQKSEDFPKSSSMIMTANEQAEYFKVLISALSKIRPEIAKNTSHLSMGFVNLKEGKMSSRTGNVVSAFWLIEEVKKRIKEINKDVSDNILEDISIGAIKWGMLKFSRESNMAFSIDESIEIEGNSGPYMQYSHARIQSILEKSGKKVFEAKVRENFDTEMLALVRLICQFSDVKKTANNKLAPSILSEYLFVLAKEFNHFYETKKVIGEKEENERLFLLSGVSKVLREGLYILGIATPNKI